MLFKKSGRNVTNMFLEMKRVLFYTEEVIPYDIIILVWT